MAQTLREEINALFISYERQVDDVDGHHFFSLPILSREKIWKLREALIDQIISAMDIQ